jgi:hypothetical protein
MAVSCDCLFDHRFHLLLLCDIGFNEDRFATSLFDDLNRLLTFPFASACNNNRRTFTGKCCRRYPPYA